MTHRIYRINPLFWLLALATASAVNWRYLWRIYDGRIGISFTTAFLSSEAHLLLAASLGALAIGMLDDTRGKRQSGLYTVFFFFTAIYVVDFIVHSITKMHVYRALKFLFMDGVVGLRKTLGATEMPESVEGYIGFLPIGIILSGYAFTRLTARFSPAATISRNRLLAVIAASLVFIPVEQAVSFRTKDVRVWQTEQLTMPFYLRFLAANPYVAEYRVRIRPFARKDREAEAFAPDVAKVPKKANVYLFVVEGLRDDFVTPETAPRLAAFKAESTSFAQPMSSSNSTHNCWFGIFQSSYPLYWTAFHDQKDFAGSPPLQFFRNAGFRVHSYIRASDLDYLDAGEMIYGAGLKLIDDPHVRPKEPTPADSDRKTIAELDTRIGDDGRNFSVVHLDGTHHSYFWPADFKPKFLPVAESFNYFKFDYAPPEVEALRNRYRNALLHLDGLFGKFIDAMKQRGLYEDAVIAVTGDHGEEFFEHGALIHGSNLYDSQVRIALYFHLPKMKRGRRERAASQIDIMPTLLDGVGIYEGIDGFVEGRSLLRDELRSRYAVASDINYGAIPYWFLLNNGRYKLSFELDRNDPLHSTHLLVKEIRDAEDKPFIPPDYDRFIRDEFWRQLKDLPFIDDIS